MAIKGRGGFGGIELLAVKNSPKTAIALPSTPTKQVRRPGLEPGFRRWQRLVITTTLSAQCALQCEHSNDLSISNRREQVTGNCRRKPGFFLFAEPATRVHHVLLGR